MTDDQLTPLPDGRALAWREYGDPAGLPVLSCHGGLLCGLDVAPFHAAAAGLGLRLISPDRPGLGASGPSAGRTVAAWADDVRALLDALGVAQAAVLGWSMGGPYALACAALLPGRITRAVVVAGALPIDDDTTFAELNPMDRRLTRLSQRHPTVAHDVFRALGELARHRPAAFAHLSARGAVPAEGAALDALEALPIGGIAEAASHALAGGDGMVEEYRAWALPWGFAAADIAVPVVIHQGAKDDLVPAAWSERLAATIPGATLRLHPDGRHFLTYADPDTVLRDLLPG
ncbi:MAG: alpha/beta hydrolase [Chloroflexota bacterium]